MNSNWYSLAWKEWHEHKWKLLAMVVTLWSLAAAFLRYGRDRDAFGAVMNVTLIGIIPFAIFLGLVAASGERARKTLPFLQSLPMPLWRIAIVKVGIALLTLTSAIALTSVFVYFWIIARNYWLQSQTTAAANPSGITGHWLFDAILICLAVVATLFIWVAATGVNRKDEISAAAISLVAVSVWLFVIGFGSYLISKDRETPRWVEAAVVSATPAWIVAFEPNSQLIRYWPSNLAVVLAINGSLLTWYVSQFGRISSREIRSPRSAVATESRAAWLPPPRKSAFNSIVWKQVWESVPVVAVGFAGTVLIAAVAVVSEYMTIQDLKAFSDAGEVFSRVAVIMGVFVALVLGIGVCHSDMQPGINSFWRTRPINPDAWFFLKFVTGLAVLLASIYVPNAFLALARLARISSGVSLNPWLLPAIQIATFASSLAIYCLVRQPIYSAILTIPLVYTGLVLVAGWLWLTGRIGGATALINLNEITDAQATVGFFISFLLSSILAWLAMRFDWGWKSRY